MKGCRALKGRNDLIHALDEGSIPKTLCGAVAVEFSQPAKFDPASAYACKRCTVAQRRASVFTGRAAFVKLLDKVDKLLTRDQLWVLGRPGLKLVDSFYAAEEPLDKELARLRAFERGHRK